MKIPLEIPDLDEEKIAEILLSKLEKEGKVAVMKRTKPYTVKEAAEALNVSQDLIRYDINAGRLVKIPSSGVVRIPYWAIEVRQAGGGKPEIQKEENRLKREGYSAKSKGKGGSK